MTRATLALLLGGLCLYASDAAHLKEPITVCQLIAHREDYSGKIVTVRGEVKAGPHFSWLVANPECKYKLVTRGVAWQNLVFMMLPNNRSPDPTDHADFPLDWAAEMKAASTVGRLGFNPDRDHLFETIVGLVYTFPDADRRVNPNLPPGSYMRTLGFGDGEALVKLLIKTRKDPIVVHGYAKNN